MSDKLLTIGDVCEVISELGINQLQWWIDNGLFEPVAGGGCKGNFRKFSPMQVVGIAVAVEVVDSPRGCCKDYIGVVVRAFARLKPKELEELIESQGPYFMTAYEDRPPAMTPNHPDNPNVGRIYQDVMERIPEVRDRIRRRASWKAGRRGAGRVRGLAKTVSKN